MCKLGVPSDDAYFCATGLEKFLEREAGRAIVHIVRKVVENNANRRILEATPERNCN
jgi:hypothetical protein